MVSAGSRSLRNGVELRDLPPGFTLIEMIVVLAVIGLILALAVPNLGRNSESHALAAAAHDVATALRLARDRAVARNHMTRFVAGADGFGSSDDKALRRVPPRIALSVIGGEPDARERARSIGFFPDGSSTGGAVEVTAGTARYTVLVDWITGNVSIEVRSTAPRR